MSIPLVYKGLCPVCGKDLSWEEIEQGKCKQLGVSLFSFEENSFKDFANFFTERTNMRLKSLQHYFSRKLLSGLSFSAFAPRIWKNSVGFSI